MKKLAFVLASAAALASGPALAADLSRPIYKAPVIAAAPYFNWSGCYIGVHGGGGWGQKRWRDPALANFEFSNHDISGGLVGGQIGCDFQTGAFVFGVEGSGSWADITGSSLDILSPGGVTLRDHSRIDAIGTFTGRIGWAWDRTLLYVKGGGAVVGDRFRATCEVAVGGCAGFPVGSTFASANDTRFGWLVGAGIEYAFTPNWSVKLEYNYMDFGRENATFSGPVFAGAPFDFNIDQRVHVVKAGINYRFNWGGPIMAAY
jgi:outer membrane immunogenic protein